MRQARTWTVLGAIVCSVFYACDDPGQGPSESDAAVCAVDLPCDTGGEGVCGEGRTTCVDGVEACAVANSAGPEICDTRDNDCDGTVDEGYGVGLPCVGEGQCAGTGVYVCADEDVVCDVDTPAVGDPELCNGLDDDCDGQVDEAFLTLGEACRGGEGRCAFDGQLQCSDDGADMVCVGVPTVAAMELCNGQDEDCDGIADEGADGGPLTTPCYAGPEGTEGVGRCGPGVQTCEGGRFGTCQGWTGPNFEVCNESDDDCDGAVDEGEDGAALLVGCYDGPQGTAGVGRCRPGTAECVAGRPGACNGQVVPAIELCDLVDDDCDGAIDETDDDDCHCEAGSERDCFAADPALEGVGRCVAGVQGCGENGLWERCRDAVLPHPEQCDDEDDDCDGTIDEGIEGLGRVCHTGLGGCRGEGTFRCVFGEGLRCDARVGAPSLERCDEVDNDCDGAVDEEFPVGAECVGGQGACATPGRLRCDPAGELRCDAVIPEPNVERCDGVDNDCDGEFDEDFDLGAPCVSGRGACAREGQMVCADDSEAYCDGLPAEPTPEVCDGRDNDCDARLDEGFGVGGPCFAGIGVCRNDGEMGCNDAGELVCGVVPSLPDLEVCNGLDDDCDGTNDEGIRPRGVCDTGLGGRCQGGTFACVDGAERCVSTREGSPEVCDTRDNDCDGVADEDLGTIDCGLGVCARELPSCTRGAPTACDPQAGAALRELCNGLDDDCDGDLDELALGDGAPCGAGVGACQREAVGQCVDGAIVCPAELGEPSRERCNGVDDDCDGATDEDAFTVDERCAVGVGQCRITGAPGCENGAPTCPLAPRAPVPEVCNALDDDCDGTLDEGFGSVVCGLGVCHHAVENCEGGDAPACDPLEGAGAEVCNGLDDDCDGESDELLPEVGQVCFVGAGRCRAEGVTECAAEGVICDGRPGLAVEERCNGLDDDCDGLADEEPVDADQPCAVGQGACRVAGALVCVAALLVCDGVPGPALIEVCNGQDDDCDGAADESLGEIECGRGACARTLPLCINGDLTGCNPFEGAQEEACNGADDDCDGQLDEQIPDGGACTVGVGRCEAAGVERCVDGALRCDAVAGDPQEERCNGVDDDCDVRVDENLGLRRACGVGEGLCRAFGRTVCDDDGEVVCNATPFDPEEESCNGFDDDCDGRTDEELDALGFCQTGRAGLCNAGRIACVDGLRRCEGRIEAVEEICNGLDDDCDGNDDEALGQQDCGVGICARQIPQCERGQPVGCFARAGARDETCNGLDDDCDGFTDEETPTDGVDCDLGVGECAVVGIGRCVDGVARCEGEAGAPVEERCNGLDDDCDDVTDEETVESATPCFVGVGGCEARAIFDCVEGAPVCPVEAGEPALEVCDTVDNDCDGAADEDFGPEVCGVGRCQHILVQCDPRGEAVECNPLEGAVLELCNDIDDDCDGATDEDLIGIGNPCRVGRGECAADGVVVCAAGEVTCDALPSDPSPEVCDGRDNDCDGQTDEDPADLPAACVLGEGDCARAGEPQCLFGRIRCEGQPAAARAELCNQVDDDCDGVTDEGLGLVECGIGVCRHQVQACVDGAAVVCDPAEGVEVEVCNGADDDCDGDVDESQGFLVCGLGQCRKQVPRCFAGQINACDPDEGIDFELCDGRDNDCDGTTDEHAAQVGDPCSAGQGICLRVGTRICVDGQLGCDATPGDAIPERCNLRDDDCDGVLDEALAEAEQTCSRGIGACTDEVPVVCVRGRFECAAVAGDPTPELCDKIDNDCDGLVDEQEDNPDCNHNGVDDRCDLEFGLGDCNGNGTLDYCDIEALESEDCNDNLIPDECNGDGIGCLPDVEPPQVQILVETPAIIPGDELVFRVVSQDNIGVVAQHGSINAEPVGLDGDGRGRRVLFAPGVVQIRADAVDFAGNIATTEAEARVLDPADANAPIIELDPLPILIGHPTALSGRIIDEGLVRWEASYGPDGAPEQTLLGTGPRFGEPFIFGVLDPAQMGAGRFHVRVEAEDLNARVAEVIVQVDIGPCLVEEEVCDGGDNDCDGEVDETFVNVGQACVVGTGTCEVVAVERCYPGILGTVCDAVARAPTVERCDGFDWDCDGALVNGFPVEEPCVVGQGECVNTGRTECDADGGAVVCDVQPSLAEEEVCDGRDNDCDGAVDNGFRTVNCGIGRCAHTVSECDADQAGNEILECDPLEGQRDEGCDGVDDDCDGVVDEAVCDDDVLPQVAIEVTALVVGPGEAVTITVIATDDQQLAARTLVVDGEDVPLDNHGAAQVVFAESGFHALQATARDAAGNEAATEQQIRVLDPDDVTPPVVEMADPVEGVLIERALSVVVTISDPNLIRWRLTYGPRRGDPTAVLLAEGDAPVDNQRIAFLDPGIIDGGLYVLALLAEDINGRGLVIERRFAVGVCRAQFEVCDGIDNDCDGTADEAICPDRNTPELFIEVEPPVADPGQAVTLRFVARDDVEVDEIEGTYDGAPLELDDQDQAVVFPAAPGAYRITGVARDGAGNEVFAESGVRVRHPDDVTPPHVLISAPADGARIDQPVSLMGTVTDEHFFRYALTISNEGEVFRPLVEGFAPVVDDVLAELDHELMIPGALFVRLSAEDWNGQESVTEVQYQVGPEHCADGPLEAPIPGCRPAPVPDTGDLYADCVARINQLRMECQCFPPLRRWPEAEACADAHAEYDSTRDPHAGFRARICEPGGSAQNECPGWPDRASTISGCLQAMWDEGPGPWGPEHGHYINMTNDRYERVACGFYMTAEGRVWAIQNFGR